MAQFTTPSGAVIDTGASNTGATVVSTPTGGESSGSGFTEQLQAKLLGQSDIISSENTNLENKIQEAISSVKSSAASSAQAITSQYDREIGYQKEQGATAIQTAQEGQRGFAQNTAALQQLTDSTNKQLKDLEMRKQELILQGNAAAASKVADLQLQAIQFHQQAQQQVFSNLLGMANFGLQADAAKRQESQFNRQQQFQEDSAKATIALQYGVTLKPGDTIQDVIQRAMPFASQKQQLELKQMQSEIDKNRAQTAAAWADAQTGARITDPLNIDILARGGLNSGGASLALVKDPTTYSTVVNRMKSMQEEDVVSAVSGYINEGLNKAAARRDANAAYQNNPQLLSIALKQIENQYGSDPKSMGGAGFKNPFGTANAFVNAKPLPPASPEAVKALQGILLGTGLNPYIK